MEPTKKLKEYGVNTLTTSELLSLIIQGKDSIAVAEDVVAYAESIGDLARIMPEELESINGIGKNKACAVSAAIELAKRLNTEKKQRVKATNTELVFDYVAPLLRHETREHFLVLFLNSKCEIESRETISIGGINQTLMEPMNTFAPALRKGAAAIILVHNHPSGNPTPSMDDVNATRKIIDAGKVMNIPVLDHIIVGESGNYSMRAEGIVEF